MQAHYAKYEPTILELKRKYEGAVKERSMAVLERDKMAAQVRVRPGGRGVGRGVGRGGHFSRARRIGAACLHFMRSVHSC